MKLWTLVTPASRGIGLAVARRLLQTTQVPVVTTARKNLDQTRESVLHGLCDVDEKRLHVLKVDVLDESSIASAASDLSKLFSPKDDHYLHLALCLPGLLFPEKSPSQINADDALLTFRTNTLGPMLLMKHFSSFLPKKSTALPDPSSPELQSLPPTSAVWATLSARVGSIGDNSLGGWYSYRASKAGVNQVAKTFDLFLRQTAGDKAMSLALHPGTVKTGLSREFWGSVREEKLFTPEFAADKLLEVVKSRGVQDRGRCWDWKGEEVPP